MQFTPEAERILSDLARRYGISPEAAQAVFRSLAAHDGRMAQFNHPDLGGMGQWLRGGMTMVGDMFNGRLKQQVDAFCSDLADALQRIGAGAAGPASARSQTQSQGGQPGRWDADVGTSFAADGAWWPAELGTPASSGAQDSVRYAVFPAARRLAVQRGGQVELYDTGDHRITGVSQQGGAGDPVFSGDKGHIRLAGLQPVGTAAQPRAEPPAASAERPAPPPPVQPGGAATPNQASPPSGPPSGDPILLIERLAELRQKGILTEEEFTAKKADLLARL